MQTSTQVALVASLGLAAIAGLAFAFSKPAAASTSPPNPAATTWPPSTFSGGANGVSPANAQAVGTGVATTGGYVLLQDTAHGGQNGAIIVAQVNSLNPSTGLAFGTVQSTRAFPAPSGVATTIAVGDNVQFVPADVLASAPGMSTILQILGSM